MASLAPTWRAERPGGGRELGGLVEVLKPGLPGRLAGVARPQQRVRCAVLHGSCEDHRGARRRARQRRSAPTARAAARARDCDRRRWLISVIEMHLKYVRGPRAQGGGAGGVPGAAHRREFISKPQRAPLPTAVTSARAGWRALELVASAESARARFNLMNFVGAGETCEGRFLRSGCGAENGEGGG